MAQLAVSLAGAAVGSLFGQPRLGFLAGSILGRVLFPTDLPGIRQTGPRLGDLGVTSSTFGAPIPIAYGTVRMGGNIIWSKDIEEVRNVTSSTQSGKGGQEQTTTTTTYSYYGTFAVAFTEGLADDVLRIWADGKLILDKSGTDSITQKKGLAYRFYNGSETQQPDSIIEADKGTNNVPAHRDLVYIVFDRLPLADYGNRIPNIEAEIAMSADPLYPFEEYTINNGFIDGFSSGDVIYDFDRKILYAQGSLSSDATQRTLSKFSVPSMTEISYSNYDLLWEDYIANQFSSIDIVALDKKDGNIIAVHNSTSTNSTILKIDPNSLKIVDAFPEDFSNNAGSVNTTTSFVAQSRGHDTVEIPSATGSSSFYLGAGGSEAVGILNIEDMSYVWGANQNLDLSQTALAPFVGEVRINSADVYWVGLEADGSALEFYKTTIFANATYDSDSGKTLGVEPENVTSSKVLTAANFTTALGITVNQLNTSRMLANTKFFFDPDSNAFIGNISANTGASETNHIISLDADDWSFNWTREVPDAGGRNGILPQRIESSQYFFVDLDTSETQVLNKFTGVIETTHDLTNWSISGGTSAAYDVDFDALVRAVNNWGGGSPDKALLYLNRADANGVTLSSIVDDLCERSGLTVDTDTDSSDLDDTNVLGYVVSRQSTARNALEPLSAAYFFDGVESDYQVKFFDRGGSSVSTIPQQDLGSVSGNEFWLQERGNEQEMPMRANVSYMDYERDYQEGTQHSKRAQNPFPVMYSRNEVSLPLPIVLDDSEAKQIAEKHLYTTWVERDRFSTALSWEYLKLDPSDVITVNLDDGTSHKVRISAIDIGADMSMRVDTLQEEIANYTSVITAENNFVASTIGNTGFDSYLKIHNVPLLADSHDQARVRSILYAQAGPFVTSSGWSGCTLYSSTDQLEWTPVTRLTGELTYGTVSGTLAAPSDVFAVDVTNTLTIFPTTGGSNLSSVTYAQLLSGEYNMMIVGSEIINFQTVTDNGNGSYTLSNLLRGRRGTDTVASSHTTGESFFLVNSSNTEGFTIPIGNINSAMYFKAVSDGQTIEQANTVTVTPTGEDLKPYAPINATRTDDSPSSGDITITWDRRTRINGSGVGTLPLNEDTESYEIDILDSSGGSVLRTLTSTSESVEYDAANVTTDFGTPPTTLYVRIYQISAQLPSPGRGKSYEFALIL